MTDFPNPLDVRIDFAFGADPNVTPSSGQWTEVPPDHWIAQSLSISRGRQNEQDQVQSNSWSFQLLNDSGDYTPDRATSPHYPHMKLGLPCRLRIGSMVRAIGNVADISPEWPAGDIESDNDPGHSLVTVTVAGMFRRLQQGEQALNSALRRWVPRQEHVVAYWPMEDEGGSFASGLRTGSPMSAFGDISHANVEKLGSKPLPTINVGAGIRGRIPIFTPLDAGYRVDWLFRWTEDEPPTANRHMLQLRTTSPNATRWFVRMSGTLFSVRVLNQDDTQVHLATETLHSRMLGNWLHCTLRVAMAGTSITYEALARNLDTDNLLPETLNHLGPSFIGGSGHTLGRPTAIDMLPPFGQPRALGHITVSRTHNLISADPFKFTAANGFPHEHAGERILRLCLEERVPVSIIGDHVDTMAMGPQPVATFTEVIQEAADTDHGILSERRNGFGLEYRTRISMYNQDPALELDAAIFPGDITHPFTPTLDDQRVRNDWTVSRPGGSSGQFVDQQHVLEHGRYDDSGSVNVPTDRPLRQIAAWRVGHGTQPGMRYPSISPALNQVPALINDWNSVRLGDRVQIIGLPTQHPIGAVDLIVQGYTETLEPHGWHVEANATPARPWNVFQIEHETFGRLWSPRAYLGEDINSSATSFDVVVPVQRAWNVDPGFEDTNSQILNEFFGDAHGWATDGGTLERSTEQAFTGRRSGRFTPSGSQSLPDVRSSRMLATAPGRTVQGSAWVMAPGALSNNVRLKISWIASTVTSSSVSLTPGVWTRLVVRTTAPTAALTNPVAVLVEFVGTPPSSDVIHIDDVEVGVPDAPFEVDTGLSTPIIIGGERMTVTAIGADDGTGAQTFTVTRSVNGVAKSHAAGAPVRLWPGHVMGL